MTLFHTLTAGNLFQLIALGVVLAIAVVTDISKRKIYNWLTLPAICLGIVLNTCLNGLHGLLASLTGIGVATLWLLLLLIPGATKAGDLKMFWAVGAIMGGWKFIIWTMLYAAISGAVFSLGLAIAKGEFKSTIQNVFVAAKVLATTKDPESIKSLAERSKVGYIPYAPAIAMGCVIAEILIRKHTV
jgi:prepilin peptidase CpaA